ncbi:MAG: hypothetical protein LUQ09_08360 [Methanomassiliicoccales archaeon]|nr:hypothetical protein [Methanomassiliicoccales archaeon]
MAASPGTRFNTGIDCIDRIVGGGFPVGGMVSLTGPCGAGKTLLAIEFLIRGGLAGQKGMYISTMHGVDKLMTFLPQLDYSDPKLFEKGTITLKHIDEMGSGERDDGKITHAESAAIIDDIISAVNKEGIKRLVLDSTNPLMAEMDSWVASSFLLTLSKELFKSKCTTILVTEGDVMNGHEQTVADGIMLLGNEVRRGDNFRVLEVVKMSGVAHSRAKYVVDMTSEGMLTTPMLRGL